MVEALAVLIFLVVEVHGGRSEPGMDRLAIVPCVRQERTR
jgi:hypothetical protein